jgi:hypothetical protein
VVNLGYLVEDAKKNFLSVREFLGREGLIGTSGKVMNEYDEIE